MGLSDEGITDPKADYSVDLEVPRKGNMHQTKDVANQERREQFQFYLQNIVLMAKNEDMSARNYSRLRAAEEGEVVNWAALYVENLRKRATNSLETGGNTIVHAHLRALVETAPEDPEAGRMKGKRVACKGLGGQAGLRKQKKTRMNFQAFGMGTQEAEDEMVTGGELRKRRTMNNRNPTDKQESPPLGSNESPLERRSGSRSNGAESGREGARGCRSTGTKGSTRDTTRAHQQPRGTAPTCEWSRG